VWQTTFKVVTSTASGGFYS